jgi:hypothetical protein
MDYSMNTVAVTHPVILEYLDRTGQATPIEAELRYLPSDPYAVTAVFAAGDTAVPWTFSRELLVEGLHEPAGDGDVHVLPCVDPDGHAVVIIELNSPNGEALMQARTADVSAFVDRTKAAVPLGTESDHLDVDGLIAAILDADAA